MTPPVAPASAPLASVTPASPAAAIIAAAQALLRHLERGQRVDAALLRTAMEAAFGGSDASGAWDWKTAYEACEAASVLFLRRFGPAMQKRAASSATVLTMLTKIGGLLPTHTRRSQTSEMLQQFSTPLPLAFLASRAAAIASADCVLEPSAGNGLLAIFAELAGAPLALNELGETRADVLGRLFAGVPVTRFDAAHIDDYLDATVRPSVVLMNPPFSVAAGVDLRMADAALRHVGSALARLADGGRLVAITGANCSPDAPAWKEAFVRLQTQGRVVFNAAVDGSVYAKHGTTMPTRLLVIDKVPAPDPKVFPPSPGMAPDAATLLAWLEASLPPRLPLAGGVVTPSPMPSPSRVRNVGSAPRPTAAPVPTSAPEAAELVYETADWAQD